MTRTVEPERLALRRATKVRAAAMQFWTALGLDANATRKRLPLELVHTVHTHCRSQRCARPSVAVSRDQYGFVHSRLSKALAPDLTDADALLAAEEGSAVGTARWQRGGAALLLVLAFWWGGLDAPGGELAHGAGLVDAGVLAPWLRALLLGGAVAGAASTALAAHYYGVDDAYPLPAAAAVAPLLLGAVLGRVLAPSAPRGKLA